MKGFEELRKQVANRLRRTWHLTLAGEDSHWPHTFALGRKSSTALAMDFARAQEWALGWRDWAREEGVSLTDAPRRIRGTTEQIPTHVTVPDIDTAARISGASWPATLRQARQRLGRMTLIFPEHPALGRVLQSAHGFSDVDFDLLCTAAAWFRENDGQGLSPRQVPVEGLHSKWLNTRRSTVADLAGVDSLGLVEVRASEVNFTYIDPIYRRGSGRVHDSVVPGDNVTPQYPPEVVIITENKDTSILFPHIPGGVSVQGHGNAGPSLITRIPFLIDAAHLFYWGDLDAKGLEIVNQYRRFGVDIETILMDIATLERYAAFATEVDERARPLTRSAPKPLALLTATELSAYKRLTDPDSVGPLRVEQERIPLTIAAAWVAERLAVDSSDSPRTFTS